MRRRCVLGLALVVAVIFSVVQAPPALAYDIDTRDTSANRSRTFNAFEDDIGTIFEIFFTTTTPNEQRRIRGLLKMVMPSTASDVMLVSRHTVYCAPAGSTAIDNQIFGVQNVLRRRAGKPPILRIAALADVPVGGSVAFNYPAGHDPCLLVRPTADALVAYSQSCTHLSCAVVPRLQENCMHCPCHEGYFDLQSGRPIAGPPRRPLPRIALEVRQRFVYATGVERRTV